MTELFMLARIITFKKCDLARYRQICIFNASFDQTNPYFLLHFLPNFELKFTTTEIQHSTCASTQIHGQSPPLKPHKNTANVQLASFISKNRLNRQRVIIAFKQHKTPVVADVLFLSLLGKAFICPLCGLSASMKNVTFCLDIAESTRFNPGLLSPVRVLLGSLTQRLRHIFNFKYRPALVSQPRRR